MRQWDISPIGMKSADSLLGPLILDGNINCNTAGVEGWQTALRWVDCP